MQYLVVSPEIIYILGTLNRFSGLYLYIYAYIFCVCVHIYLNSCQRKRGDEFERKEGRLWKELKGGKGRRK